MFSSILEIFQLGLLCLGISVDFMRKYSYGVMYEYWLQLIHFNDDIEFKSGLTKYGFSVVPSTKYNNTKNNHNKSITCFKILIYIAFLVHQSDYRE